MRLGPAPRPHLTPPAPLVQATGPASVHCRPDAHACPCCGHRPTPYTERLSAVVDMVLPLEAIAQDLKHGIEEMAL